MYLSLSVPSRIGERLPVGPASTPIPSVARIAAGFGVSRFTIYRHPHQDGAIESGPRARHGGSAVRPRRRGESSAMAVRDQVTINDALEAFLAEQRGRLAAKTLRRYEDVVWLLRECLDRYGHSSLSADERRRWEKTFEGGEEDAFCRLFGPEKIPAHIDEFLDWFMVRKVMAGQDLLKASGTVTGKLVRWLAGHGYIDEDVAEDAAERAREASRDLPMADRLATLLHEVADGAPEVDVDALAEEDWVEDQLAISDVEPGRIWFEGGVGPIAVPRKASDLARPGWSAFVTAARTDGAWRLLEVGFVYP